MNEGRIVKVSGPLVIAEGMRDSNMFDVVRVGKENLIGEILEIHDDRASIQVYEETSGLGPGAPVVSTMAPLSVELGPGLIENIFDGIQRPLEAMRLKTGGNITRGISVPALDRSKRWHFIPRAKAGDHVQAGDIIGVVQENEVFEHKIMIPYGIEGTLIDIFEGQYTIEDTIARVETRTGSGTTRVHDLTMIQKWPVRQERPYKERWHRVSLS